MEAMEENKETTVPPVTADAPIAPAPKPKEDTQVPQQGEPAASTAEPSLEEKLRAAKLAMEGPQYTAKREARERDEVVKAKHEQIEARLAEIAKEKEKLEIQWIELDEQRAAIKQALAPLLEEEQKTEEAEAALEEQERSAVTTPERQQIEQRRYETQTTRRKIEEGKWGLENEIGKFDAQIEENTSKYRVFLDEEEQLHTELSSLTEDQATS